MKFRKKPVVIEAVEIDAEEWFLTENETWPEWVQQAIEDGQITYAPPTSVQIATREGVMRGERYDMLIKGVKGELYPCKPDIFAATYEQVE